MKRTWLAPAAAILLAWASAVRAAPVAVVAAENMYGDVARAIGGDAVAVQSILSNPSTDPHFFEASPAVARALAGASVVIVNGAGYDPWMTTLLQGSDDPARQVVSVADLVHAPAGGNPHLWYAPETMRAVARALTDLLVRLRPGEAAPLAARRDAFLHRMDRLDAEIAAMRARFAGQNVTATEPVFGLMAGALGLRMRNERFQLAVMNDTEPRASDVAAMESDLRSHTARVLFYNAQVTDASTQRLLDIARRSGVPVVGVTETMPADKHYVDWMLAELNALAAALGTRS